MQKNIVLDMITNYRKSVAFISAFESGVFEHMQNRTVGVDKLSVALHADKLLLELFLRYLKSIGLVEEESSGQWSLKDDFAKNLGDIKKYKDIIAHEKNLFNKWLLPDCITSSVANGMGGRHFDVEGFSLAEKKAYFTAMNGRNLDVIAFWTMRELMGRQNINCLEIGRSIGALSLFLNNRVPGMNVTVVFDKDYLPIYDLQIRDCMEKYNPKVFVTDCFDFCGEYNLVCMYNTIHYYPGAEAVELLRKLRGCMSEKPVICIADIFLKSSDRFTASVLLDWITHGGVHSLRIKDVESIMEEAGFKITKCKNIAEVSTDLIFGTIV